MSVSLSQVNLCNCTMEISKQGIDLVDQKNLICYPDAISGALLAKSFGLYAMARDAFSHAVHHGWHPWDELFTVAKKLDAERAAESSCTTCPCEPCLEKTVQEAIQALAKEEMERLGPEWR